MELISMTDFVLEQSESEIDSDVFYFLCSNYAQFLKQPLNIGMFIPCDDEGNVLEEPIFREAKDNVLFEFDGGIRLVRNKGNFFIIEDINGVYLRVLKNNTETTVESLFKFSVGVKLTESAIKQIGI